MKVRRIVANIAARDVAAGRRFYQEILGLDLLMDLGWIATYGSQEKMSVQVSIASQGGSDTAQLAELTTVFAGAVQEISADLLNKGYDRKYEFAAHAMGAKFLGVTGYPRAALTSYLKRMGSEGGSGGWYGTHPKAEDRLECLGALPADPAQVLTGLAVRTDRFKKVLGG